MWCLKSSNKNLLITYQVITYFVLVKNHALEHFKICSFLLLSGSFLLYPSVPLIRSSTDQDDCYWGGMKVRTEGRKVPTKSEMNLEKK